MYYLAGQKNRGRTRHREDLRRLLLIITQNCLETLIHRFKKPDKSCTEYIEDFQAQSNHNNTAENQRQKENLKSTKKMKEEYLPEHGS